MPCKSGYVLWVCLLAAGWAAPLLRGQDATTTQPAPTDGSLATRVPADVGLFVELRQGADLLLPLMQPQAWATLASLAGNPVQASDSGAWAQRVQDTLGMSPADAIRTLFAQRVALAGERWRQAADAVVLCLPNERPRELVRRWGARPLPSASNASVFRLPHRVGVAVQGPLLALGDYVPDGMLAGVVRVLEGGAHETLADDATYRRLLARVPPNPDGIFFARLAEVVTPASSRADGVDAAAASMSAPTTQPAPRPAAQPSSAPAWRLPGPLRDSQNVLVALHRSDSVLQFSAVGDGAARSGGAAQVDVSPLAGSLPVRTLVTWAGQVDYDTLPQAIALLPRRNILRVVHDVHARAGTIQRLTGALAGETALALGVVAEEHAEAPPLPAFAALLVLRDAGVAAEEWGNLVQTTLSMYKLLALKRSPPPPPLTLETLELEGARVQRVRLGTALGLVGQLAPLSHAELCWTIDDDVLIIATHTDWLAQILAARHARGLTLTGVIEALHRSPAKERASLCIAQTGPIADLGRLWLDYLGQIAPQVLDEQWWRAFQPGGGNVRLGVQVTADAGGHRLSVVGVTPGGPSAGLLSVGDEIVGCNDRRFETDDPVAEIQRALRQRPQARWVQIIVERARIIRVVRVPLPFVDPVQALRQLVAVGDICQRVIFSDDPPDEAGPRGFLTVELRGTRAPLFEFMAAKAPQSQPAPPQMGTE